MRWVPVVAGAGVLAGVVLGAALVAPAIAARDDAIAMQYLIPGWKFNNKMPCMVR